MAFIPTDPTKAEVRVIGTAPNQSLDFYIPRGPKGDPGGLTNTVIPIGTDLDGYLTVGAYSVTNGVDNAASALAHLPVHMSGTLLVTFSQAGSIQIQTFISNTQNMYVRRRFNNVWGAWRAFSYTRVDTTAGRAIYTFDDVNGREQMIYGDTGRRDITASFPVPTAGKVYLSRSGVWCQLIFADYQDGSASGTLSVPAGTIPAGFRPQNWLYQPAPSARLLVIKADGGLTLNSHSATVWQGSYMWRSEDAWPTTLPGTATGTLPI
jgi:hypothetical protein